VDEYWELLSSLQSYSQRRVTHTEALHHIHQHNYTLSTSLTTLRQLANFPPPTASPTPTADDADHVALTDPACTVCGDGGNVFLCDAAGCRRVYHADCLQLDGVPSGAAYECPAHFCRRCRVRVVDPCQSCRSCPSAFCDVHIGQQRQHHFRSDNKPTNSVQHLAVGVHCCDRSPTLVCACRVVVCCQSKWRSWVERRHCSISSRHLAKH